MLDDPWLNDVSLVSEAPLDRKSKAFNLMKKATERDVFQAAVISYITNMIASSQDLEELRRVFDLADTDKSGTLSLEEL